MFGSAPQPSNSFLIYKRQNVVEENNIKGVARTAEQAVSSYRLLYDVVGVLHIFIHNISIHFPNNLSYWAWDTYTKPKLYS